MESQWCEGWLNCGQHRWYLESLCGQPSWWLEIVFLHFKFKDARKTRYFQFMYTILSLLIFRRRLRSPLAFQFELPNSPVYLWNMGNNSNTAFYLCRFVLNFVWVLNPQGYIYSLLDKNIHACFQRTWSQSPSIPCSSYPSQAPVEGCSLVWLIWLFLL